MTTLVTKYINLPQCAPTGRNEVSKVYFDITDNDIAQSRMMHNIPTYQLQFAHNNLSIPEFNRFDTFWKASKQKEIELTWEADNQMYLGIFLGAPDVAYNSHNTVNVTVTLLVKRIVDLPAREASFVNPGKPGIFYPSNAMIPAHISDLIRLGNLQQLTAWASGEYVTLRDGTEAWWDRYKWVAGRAVAGQPITALQVVPSPGPYAAGSSGHAVRVILTGMLGVNGTVKFTVNPQGTTGSIPVYRGDTSVKITERFTTVSNANVKFLSSTTPSEFLVSAIATVNSISFTVS